MSQNNKLCIHGLACPSAKNNVCLIEKESIFEMEKCPRKQWYRWREGAVTQIILAPGVKR